MRQVPQESDPSPYDRYVAARRRSRVKEGVIVAVVLACVIAYSLERRSHDAPQPRPPQAAAGQTH